MTRTRFFALGAAAMSPLLAAGQSAPAPQPRKIDPEKIDYYEREDIEVPDFAAQGFLLDIGGGGEGVIGQIKGAQTVAIDLSKRELEEAPPGPLKIVMDAADLKFLDGSFETVTAFFSFMYMPPEVLDRVWPEVARVLHPKGRFLLWDPVVPAQPSDAKEYAVFRYTFKLPGKEVKTGYGTRYRPYVRDAEYHIAAAAKAGLQPAARKAQGRTFFVEFRKA